MFGRDKAISEALDTIETLSRQLKALTNRVDDLEDTLTRRVNKLLKRADREESGPETAAERVQREILERRRNGRVSSQLDIGAR